MGSVLEIVDAVKGLTPTQQYELFARLRESGIVPPSDAPAKDYSRYESEEFTRQLTECFHRGKRRALESR